MQYKAKQRYADVSARKLRLFADLIRGRNVDEALMRDAVDLAVAMVESLLGEPVAA